MNIACRVFEFLLITICAMHCAWAQPEPSRVSEVLDAWVTKTERQVVPAADAMPEERFAFVPKGEKFKGVRSFAEQVKHLAAANYQLGGAILNEQPPAGTHDESAPNSVQTKLQILEYVKGSFTCLHRAAASVDETTLTRPTQLKGRGRLWLMIDALEHSSNHYGQMVEYLRMNEIVPPESR
jgi:hypothetical protein